jgi:putative FmdB family regulatory protein
MPLYEYQCEACGHRFEVIQKYSDAPIEACPTCGGAVVKLLSSPAIQFKGTGWYITDYARAGTKDGGSGKTDGGKSEGGKSDSASSGGEKTGGDKGGDKGSSDTKSETKSESTPASKSTD